MTNLNSLINVLSVRIFKINVHFDIQLFNTHMRILLIIIFAFLVFDVFGQDVILLSQQDIDQFDENVTTINGDLIIGSIQSPSDITNLNGLSNIRKVIGNN